MIALLNVHPSRKQDLREPDILRTDPWLPIAQYEDSFGNSCARFVAPVGEVRLYNSFLVEDSGEPDPVFVNAQQAAVDELPPEVLRYLLASRYCETDLLLKYCLPDVRSYCSGLGARTSNLRLGL